MQVMDGNEAAARVAYLCSEAIAIYPITPASPMGELADEWSAHGEPNLWGQPPRVVEMQSEAGAAGVVHGALQAGALATTFTASQGLLLMIPDMYKIAGELTATVFHIAARTVATHALSIFGDHSDVMAARATGFAMLFSGSVQEAMDLALVAHAATLRTRLPFLHVFDGFRTSHELATVEPVTREQVRALIREEDVLAHRRRGLSPDHPVVRGTAQNPDVFFQAREACSPFYAAAPRLIQETMDELGQLTGRPYRLFKYSGHPQAETVLVIMGSGSRAARRAVELVGGRLGVLEVHLYRPFSVEHFLAALPATVKDVVVLDRTKEAGAPGEPLFLDVSAALAGGGVRVRGGRYGLSSKDFTPAMAAAALSASAPHGFTVGIHDDVSGTSLTVPELDGEPPDTVRAIFWGLGSDGTVGANKATVKLVVEGTALYGQGYFVYDSKKAGARTISHLRFSPRPLEAPWLVAQAGFVGIHQFDFVRRYPVLENAEPGATVLLNSPHPAAEVWDRLPQPFQRQVLERGLRLWVVNAYQVAREAGLAGRINTVMQTCFFHLCPVLPDALPRLQKSLADTYSGELVDRNRAAVERALAGLEEVDLDGRRADGYLPLADLPPEAPPYLAALLAGHGDAVPVSELPADGTFPSGTSRFEKRNLAVEVPAWHPEPCIECGKCVLLCPHAAIRAKVVPAEALAGAPAGLAQAAAHWKELRGQDQRYVLAVAPEDCTGCTLCVEACPVPGALTMGPAPAESRQVWEYFLGLPDEPAVELSPGQVKNLQLRRPLFEFSGACSGCGETPYLKLLTQLVGDRLMVANATGCSSIFGGNLPTTPWSRDAEGRGPAWSNSLFEDNAEFGLGMRVGVDLQADLARHLLSGLSEELGPALVEAALDWQLNGAAGLREQRARLALLRERLEARPGDERAARLLAVLEQLVPRSIWLVGGDGWAYDIGYGGLDHVLASGSRVRALVLDTEVYSNTGGQASKATPLGAVARFAAAGKRTPKKDLGLLAMTYGHIYVAQVALGARDQQAVRAFREAEGYAGPALIVAYSPCIAHGFALGGALEHQRLAVETGYWPLYRFHPDTGLQLDSKPPARPLADFLYAEERFAVLREQAPEQAAALLHQAEEDVRRRWQRLTAAEGS